MPTARCTFATGVVDGRIYAVGGAKGRTDALRRVPLQTVEEYDPVTDTWIGKTDMPTARSALSVSVVNGRIYAIGGAEGIGAPIQTVEEYDPVMDTWTKKADMPTPRFAFSTSVVNGKIYAIGGSKGGSRAISTVEEYDPITDTWIDKAVMPTARLHLSTGVVDGKIYAIGGAKGAPSYASLLTVEVYDPMTDTWTKKANMSTAGCTLCTCSVGGKIYAIGGATPIPSVAPLSTVQEYDPLIDVWTKKTDMPTARSGLSASAVNGKIYAIGGLANPNATALSVVEEYDTGFIAPSPDFNGDGTVDIKDLERLIESWGQDDPLWDIAPQPFGDGIVDALDLELLMSYWGQPVDDPTLIAHWTLDEAEGAIAYDSAGVNDALVVGGTAWQPSGGQVNGALQFEGIDGCAVTDSILNPASGSFSVFAWIQGGAPDQVILSQQGSANWLALNPSWGCLMTDLRSSGRGGCPLQSEVVVTDGNWHRVGFVWDGLYRTLYIDDILVAEDTQKGLESSIGGLNIGRGSSSAAGTFWSGLIDDVRIYNRIVSP
jgi:N-acetylneuraminic acid mutarotase